MTKRKPTIEAPRTDMDRAVEIVRESKVLGLLTRPEAAELVKKGIELGRVLGPKPFRIPGVGLSKGPGEPDGTD